MLLQTEVMKLVVILVSLALCSFIDQDHNHFNYPDRETSFFESHKGHLGDSVQKLGHGVPVALCWINHTLNCFVFT